MSKPSGTFPLLPAKRYGEVPVVLYTEINSFNCEGLRGGGSVDFQFPRMQMKATC
jgi:hypothetical protein